MATHELRTFQELYPQFEEAGAEIVGISADDLPTQQRFSDSFGDGLQFPLVADSDKTVIGAYGTQKPDGGNSKRMTFIIARNGTISFVNPDVDPRSEAQYAALLESVRATAEG